MNSGPTENFCGKIEYVTNLSSWLWCFKVTIPSRESQIIGKVMDKQIDDFRLKPITKCLISFDLEKVSILEVSNSRNNFQNHWKLDPEKDSIFLSYQRHEHLNYGKLLLGIIRQNGNGDDIHVMTELVIPALYKNQIISFSCGNKLGKQVKFKTIDFNREKEKYMMDLFSKSHSILYEKYLILPREEIGIPSIFTGAIDTFFGGFGIC